MGGTDDGIDELTPAEQAAWDEAGETAVYGPGVAAAVRRAALLAGLVPLDQMTGDEVAWVFADLVRRAEAR